MVGHGNTLLLLHHLDRLGAEETGFRLLRPANCSTYDTILSAGNSAGIPRMCVGRVAAQISNDITEVIDLEWWKTVMTNEINRINTVCHDVRAPLQEGGATRGGRGPVLTLCLYYSPLTVATAGRLHSSVHP